VILSAQGISVGFYVAIILVTASLHPWQDLARRKMATLQAFQEAFQSDWLVKALVAVAIVSLVKVLNGCFLAATRQVFVLSRAGLLHPGLAAVHPRSMTPTRAVLVVGILTAGGCLLGRSVLVPISEVGSLAYVVGWMATCWAYCHPKWRKGGWQLGVGLVGATVATGLLSLKFTPGIPGVLSKWEFASLGGWVVLGLLLYSSTSVKRVSPGEPSGPPS
jgi:amino acid transporter